MGGGAAGLGCALSAANRGANIVLIEKTAELGGTVTHALIHTIGGLFDDNGNFLNEGITVELVDRLERACSSTRRRRIGKTWVLNVDPAIYARVSSRWVESIPNIVVRYEARVAYVSIDLGNVEHIEGSCQGKSYSLRPHALVDTTGNASLIRHVDETLVADGAASGGFIVQVRGLAQGAMQFPKGVALLREIRNAVDKEELPRECSAVWLDTGVYPDEAYVKFGVPPDGFDVCRMRLAAQRLLAFLKRVPGFAEAFVYRYGELGERDAGRIHGEYCLTERDVKQSKRFEDVACRGNWPIEHWHPQSGISLEYLPPGSTYDIPLRSMKVLGFNNLWAAGKCLSAEPRAQASARIAGVCWAMGEAVGKHITG